MYSPAPIVDSRRAAYARLASRVLETLNGAVARRLAEGKTQSEIAERIGCHRSLLSRAINGTTPNLTLRTIADILWATDYEPRDFEADALEDLNENCRTHIDHEVAYASLFEKRSRVVDVDLLNEVTTLWLSQPSASQVSVEHAVA